MASRRRVKSGDWWRILYRVGGRDRCRWVCVLAPYERHAQAMSEAKDIARQGYKVVLMRDKHLQSVGPPEGWEADDANAGHYERGWWIREPKPA